MIKIYCILFDTLILNKSIISLAKHNKMAVLRQIGSCFTNNSCIEMLTGKMPSDLRYHGMGHLCHNKYRDRKTNKIQWPWEDNLLLPILLKEKWNIKYHNGEHFSNVIYDKSNIKKTSSIRDDTVLLSMSSSGIKLMKEEQKRTKEFQKEKISKHTFYFVRHEHYHKAVDLHRKKDDKKVAQKIKIAVKKSIDIMNYWNMEEPDSIFWFFSDHGNWNFPFDLRHPNPQNYLSFVLFKDNTKNPIKVGSKFMCIRDFFPTIMDKFGYKYDTNEEICSISSSQNKNRIYYVEDGRKKINDDISTTGMACKFVNWEENFPKGILQVSYHICNNKWMCKFISLDKYGITKEIINKKDVDNELKEAVIRKFDWIRKKYE